MNSVQEIIDRAGQAFCALAAEVGVDGAALMGALPEPGYLMKGRAVPVIAPNYKDTCSVLFFINFTREGFAWPFVRFHTFKYGGAERTFNGLDWLRNHPEVKLSSGLCPSKLREKSNKKVVGFERAKTEARTSYKARAAQLNAEEDKKRTQRHQILAKQYADGAALAVDHPWVSKRLKGHATDALLNRVDIKVTPDGRMLAPLVNAHKRDIGFHQIRPLADGDEKRHFVRKSGLLKGSYIRLSPAHNGDDFPVALCEGLATGLSVALVWPGEVRIALTAGNLKPVRDDVEGRAVLFSDEDVWKPEVGNIGRQSALLALKPGDGLCMPVFKAQSKQHKPTDFNDVLMLEGIDALSELVFAIL